MTYFILAMFLIGGAVGGALCCDIASTDAADSGNIEFVDNDYGKVGSTLKIKIHGDMVYEYTAMIGDGSSGSISPSSGTLDNERTAELTITLPSKAGDYKIEITYKLDGEEKSKISANVKAVDPITLKATVKNSGKTDISFNAFFIVDGEKKDDSHQWVTVTAGGTKDVTYDYIIKDTKNIKYCLDSEDDLIKQYVKGLGEENMKEVFTGKNDYTVITVILSIIVVVLVLVTIWVVRKPVINKGKPKARR